MTRLPCVRFACAAWLLPLSLTLALTLAWPLPAAAQPVTPEPSEAAAVRLAHQQATAGRCLITHTTLLRDGVWTTRRTADMSVAFDRAANRWRVSHPDFQLQIIGDRLRLTAEMFPGRHLETTIANPTQYAQLFQQISSIHQPPLAPLVLVMAKEPWHWLARSNTPTITAAPAPGQDAQQGQDGIAVRVASMNGQWLITTTQDQADRTASAAWASVDQLPQTGEPMAAAEQDIRWTHWGESPPDESFALDVAGSVAVGSLQELMNPNAGGPSGSGAGGGNRAVGGDVPDFALTDMQGNRIEPATLKKGIVVLDFWATWADPSVGELQRLEKAYNTLRPWAEKSDVPLLLLAVNLQDSAEDIQAFVKRIQTAVPLARDEDSSAADALNIMGIPQLVVLRDGKIIINKPGPVEKLDTELVELIKPWLAEKPIAATTTDDAQTPAQQPDTGGEPNIETE